MAWAFTYLGVRCLAIPRKQIKAKVPRFFMCVFPRNSRYNGVTEKPKKSRMKKQKLKYYEKDFFIYRNGFVLCKCICR